MGQKLEAIVSRNGDKLNVEGTQAGVVPLSALGLVYVNTKVNKNVADVAVAYNAGGVFVGGNAILDVNGKNLKEWSAAAAAKNVVSGVHLSVKTQQLRNYTIGVSAPAPVSANFSPRVACYLKYNAKNKEIDGEGGVQVACPLIPGNELKIRCNKQKDWRITYIAKLPGDWLCALSVDKNKKTGVVLSSTA
ncbi:hypothetical protein, conserved [Angomonas deanei]|uniref:Uncharacterized protein n=1 Tax=Angomonas deanei TaxID=59799 RepID=A0A7G2BYZ7_9TRYP|nr:hypothetical protein, conserved [Angomonas deanei]